MTERIAESSIEQYHRNCQRDGTGYDQSIDTVIIINFLLFASYYVVFLDFVKRGVHPSIWFKRVQSFC